ncbi:DUF4245 domain-containing protein [Actinomadura sp. 21ATH]|uniref:DUF4245 domain-containing protein n=1 Tax=Actinomadura sp. 21ATH TaxID=1735444 RepID=UPI0035C149AE
MSDKTSASPSSPSSETEPAPAAAETGGPGTGGPETAAGPDAAGRGTVQVSPGVYKRLTTGLGGFSLAMVASLALVGVIYLITPRSDEEVLPKVDYSTQLWAMRSDAPYTVYAPEGLPATWRPTSSRMHGLGGGGPVAWHLGFLTPREEYAALEQSNEKPAAYIPRMTNIKKSIGTQQVNGVAWTKHHREDKNARSLVRTLPEGPTLVVTGTASFEELAVLAGALKPQPKQGGGPVPAKTGS